MSEIFYSEVDRALQEELNARGRAGKTDRSTKALNFMLGKIANVELIAYEDQSRETELHTLGGTRVRQGEYLPTGTTNNPGFLNNRTTNVIKNSWKSGPNGEIQLDSTSELNENQTTRIPPYITSADVNIGDHSMGLLNKSTININIPNPQSDLDFFETVWLRPGRHVVLVIEHPNSAVLTNGELNDALPSTEKIRELNPNVTERDLENFKKMNRYEFYGLITNWNFSYNEDASVTATINLTGTSNVYTDVSLLMSPSNEKKRDVPINVNVDTSVGVFSAETQATVTNALLSIFSPSSGVKFPPSNFTPEPLPVPPPETDEDGNPVSTPLPIYDDLETEIDNFIREELKKGGVFSKQKPNTNDWVIHGKPYTSGSVQSETYITLSYLVNYMNDVIIKKLKNTIDPINGNSVFVEDIKIVFTDEKDLCVSNYYENIVSADPERVLLMDSNKKTNKYGKLIWYDELKNYPNFHENSTAYPSRIFINLETIHDIIESLSVNQTEFNVNNFFKQISSVIAINTAYAVNLNLQTHPTRTNILMYYDSHCVFTENNKNVRPYNIPMFANDINGTIVRKFSFSAKIPDSVKNLSFVLNQNPEEISELDLAPYMNFMYNSSNVIRTNNNDGTVTEIQNPDAEKLLNKLKQQYKDKHNKYRKDLETSKENFGKDPKSITSLNELKQALTKYIQYPTDVLTNTNQLTAPIFPFDADITIDGINGFRYGDVIQFNALPARYRTNVVFCIINVTHTVDNNGDWQTKLKCIMRPKFE